jgi:hypothetical protein
MMTTATLRIQRYLVSRHPPRHLGAGWQRSTRIPVRVKENGWPAFVVVVGGARAEDHEDRKVCWIPRQKRYGGCGEVSDGGVVVGRRDYVLDRRAGQAGRPPGESLGT